jgi:hypothetical protein
MSAAKPQSVREKLATKCCDKPRIVVVSSGETECWVCRTCKKEVKEGADVK